MGTNRTDPDDLTVPPKAPGALVRTLRRVAVLAALGLAFLALMMWARDVVTEMNSISGAGDMTGLLLLALLAYAVLIALPFMPGIEVGIALLLLKGAAIAPFVYLATVSGLMCAYLVGRWLPLDWLQGMFRDLRLHRACRWISTIQTTPVADRLSGLEARLPAGVAPLVVRYRYVMIGVLLNLPGTFAIGGGGGILMLCGIVRLFSGWKMLLTLMIATSPVPLTVWIMGADYLR